MSTSAYRLLIRLLPEHLRSRHGDEIESMFRADLEAAVSPLARLGVWARGALDIVAEAVRARLPDWLVRRPGRRPEPPRRGSGRWGAMTDLRHGLRGLRKSPGYTLVAVVILSVGIGANSALFSLVNAAFLRAPAHVERPDELVGVFTSDFSGPLYGTSSYPDLVDFREGASAIADATYFEPSTVTYAGSDGSARILLAERVGGNYFELLGVRPVAGRAFTAEESDHTSGVAAAIISHGMWTREFGASAGAVGSVVRLSGQPVTIVGVAPAGFGGSLPVVVPDVWIPESTQALMSGAPGFEHRGSRGMLIRARLAPGATIEQVQAQLTAVASRIHEVEPGLWTDVNDEVRRVTVVPDSPVPPQARGVATGVAALLMAVLGTVLLIACANLANLTLARVSRRQREVAVRVALGAGRWRLIRQLLAESVALGALGGLGGAGVAYVAVRLAETLRPSGAIQLQMDLALDPSVYFFLTGVTVFTVLIVGLLPAIRASRPDLVPALKEGSESTPARFRWYQLRNLLVVGQVSASVVLLVAAGLLLRSIRATMTMDPGFDPVGVASLTLNLEPEGHDRDTAAPIFQELVDRVGALPEVTSVALADRIPLGLGSSMRGIGVPGYEPAPGEELAFQFFVVGPEFFQTLSMEMVAGRAFDEGDGPSTGQVAVVSRSFAEKFWPDEEWIGKVFSYSGDGDARVVGVVEDARYVSLNEAPQAAFFVPDAQLPGTLRTIVARTRGAPEDLLPALQAQTRAVVGPVPLVALRTYEEAIATTLIVQRITSWVLSAAGVLGLLLATVGLYGVMNYLVSQRTREVGVRMALGADRRQVVRMIVLQGLVLAAVGAVIGVGLAGLATPFAGAFLVGIRPLDPVAFLLLPLGAAIVAGLASYLPARRAARVDPVRALRHG